MSNTFVTPRVVSTIAQSRIDYNSSLTSLLQNFASIGAPSSASVSLEGVTGLQPGMLWYKSGTNTSDGQGRFFVYNGTEFTRNGLAAYRMPSVSAANSAAVAGSISYGDLILTGDNNLYIVNTSNTGVLSVSASAQTLSGLVASQFMRRDIDSNSIANVSFNSNSFIKVPVGNVAQRPSAPGPGMIRFNTASEAFEGYDGSVWGTIGTQTFINDGTYVYYNGGLPVGIGTATPTANLHVVGTGTLLRLETAGSEDQVGPSLQFYQKDTTIVANQGYGGIEWRGDDVGNDGVRGYVKGFSSGASGEFSVRLATQNTGSSNPIDRLTINPLGNVGIGVVNANTLLQVNGNISVSGGDVTVFNRGSNFLAFGTNNREAFRVTPTGNLAYGTSSPSSNIQFNGTGALFRLQTAAADTEGITQRFHQTDTTIITDQSYGGIEWEGNDAGGAGLRGFVKGFADGNNGEFSVRIATQGSGASNPVVRMTVGATGNVGIGTSSPSQTLDVVGNVTLGTQTNRATLRYVTNTARAYTIPDAGSDASFVMTSGAQTLAGDKTFSNTLTVSGSGINPYSFVIAHANASVASNSTSGMNTANVELQALEFRYTGSSPNATMARIATVNYNTDGTGWFGITSRYRAGLAFHTVEQNTLSERMRITNLGDVGIGTTTPASKLQVIGEVTATDFNSTSDASLKENIAPISSALEKLASIKGVTFNFISDTKKRAGVIAQDVETVFPEAVSDIGGVKNVSYNNLIGLLVEAIKEQQQEIKTLREYVFQNTSK